MVSIEIDMEYYLYYHIDVNINFIYKIYTHYHTNVELRLARGQEGPAYISII